MAQRFEPEDVLTDLLYLRKGRGCTDERFGRCNALIGVLGGAGEPWDVLRERLESAIWSLRDDDAALLMDIYALSEETARVRLLSQRRDAVASKLGIGREAAADRDTAAVQRLLTQLITGWYPKSPMGLRVPESHNGTVQHAVHVRTVVSDGRHLESRHHYRLFTLFDGAEYLAIVSGNPTVIVMGEDFTVRTTEIPGGYHHAFWHKEPMRRGQTYDLAFKVPGDPTEEAWLMSESLAFHEPTRFAVFEVLFLGEQPEYMWEFGGLTAPEAPGVPSTERLLEPGPTSSVKAEFRDLYGGLFAGVAWEWNWSTTAQK